MARVDSLIGQVLSEDGVWSATVFDGWTRDVEPDGLVTVTVLIDCHNGITNRDIADYIQTNVTGSYYRGVTDEELHQRMRYKANYKLWELAHSEVCEDVDLSELIPVDRSG